jgi:adenosylmethionine-8-amino-7-oxononanoate aminotransferase
MGEDASLPAKVGGACREAGMLIRPLVGGALAVSPPLVIDDESIAEMAEAFRAGLDAVAAD